MSAPLPPAAALLRPGPRPPRWLALGALGPALLVGCDGRDAAEASALYQLEAALQQGDPAVVSEAARAAGPLEGQDPALDLALARAFAGPLARPEQAWPLVNRRALPGDEAALRLLGRVALQVGSGALLDASDGGRRLPRLPPEHPALDWLGARAAADPSIDWETALRAVEDCALLDSEPQRGRRPVDAPLPADFDEAARALGARGALVGRPRLESDPPPARGLGPMPCAAGLLLPGLPDVPHRQLTVAARLPEGEVWLSVVSAEGEPWVASASDPAAARRWLEASSLGPVIAPAAPAP